MLHFDRHARRSVGSPAGFRRGNQGASRRVELLLFCHQRRGWTECERSLPRHGKSDSEEVEEGRERDGKWEKGDMFSVDTPVVLKKHEKSGGCSC